MKRILFPTNFTDASIRALKEALIFNDTFGYDLLIFHAYSRPVKEKKLDFNIEQQLEKLETSIDREFDKLLSKVPELKAFNFQFKKQLGYSIDLIVEQIEEENIGLIVMNTEGAAGLGEIWGTKTAKIIKQVDIPVLVIPTGTSLSNVEKLGLACDFSKNTEYPKLSFLVDVAEQKNLPLDIITLNRQEKTMTNEELSNRENVLSILKNINSKVSFTHHDDVKQGLIDYTLSHDIDLLAVLPKSYSYIERAFHDSLTTSLAFNSPLPLLVLK